MMLELFRKHESNFNMQLFYNPSISETEKHLFLTKKKANISLKYYARKKAIYFMLPMDWVIYLKLK